MGLRRKNHITRGVGSRYALDLGLRVLFESSKLSISTSVDSRWYHNQQHILYQLYRKSGKTQKNQLAKYILFNIIYNHIIRIRT